MKIPIELPEESRDLLANHFLRMAPIFTQYLLALDAVKWQVVVYAFKCEPAPAEALLAMARNHCPPAAKDIEHAIFAATAG